jgi:hypothetical protein
MNFRTYPFSAFLLYISQSILSCGKEGTAKPNIAKHINTLSCYVFRLGHKALPKADEKKFNCVLTMRGRHIKEEIGAHP